MTSAPRLFARYARLAPLLLGVACVIALTHPAVAPAHLTLLQPTPGDPATFSGHGGYSADGSCPGHSIRAEVPAGSTVQQAYLYSTYFASVSLTPGDRTIDFDGTNVETAEIPGEVFPLRSARADVTSQVAAKVGSGGGLTSFEVGVHVDSSEFILLHGVALVVIYSNPTSPLVSVAVLDGGANPAGDTAQVDFSSPLEPNAPGFEATIAIGDGYSLQNEASSHGCGPEPQDTAINIDGQRLTSCAGGSDDGHAYEHLITVGGIGDSTDNPSDPYTTTEGEEDELYSLRPFLKTGDTHLSLETSNASGDDDLFLAIVKITAGMSVGAVAAQPQAPPRSVVAPSASLPRACLSARRETLHWRTPRGVRLKGLAVRINGKLYRRLAGSTRAVNVILAGRPRETVQVIITGTGVRGRRYSSTRTYLTCRPGTRHALANMYLKA